MQIKLKLKKPWRLKPKHHKTQKSEQKQQNQLYELLKKQSHNSRRFKTLQDDHDFYIKLDQMIKQQPAKVIGKQLGRVQRQRQLQRRRKSLQKAALQPKKSYENFTQSFYHRIPSRRTKSFLPNDNSSNQYQRNLCHSSTGLVRTITNSSNVPQQATVSFNRQSKKPINHRLTSSSHSSYLKKDSSYNEFSQQYNNAFQHLIKDTKTCSSSMHRQQKKLSIISQFHQKMYKHFDKLAIKERQLEHIQFDDLNSIRKVQRYKFSTNNFLQNVLLKKDKIAKDWIQKQNKKQLRKNTMEIVRQKVTDNILQQKCVKLHKQNFTICTQLDKNKLSQSKHKRRQSNQQPKRIKDILKIKNKL